MEAAIAREILLHQQISELMSDLKRFVTDIQNPQINDSSWLEEAHRYCQELARRLAELQREFQSTLADTKDSLSDSLEELGDSIRAYSRDVQESFEQSLEELRESLRTYARELAERPNVRKLKDLYDSMAGGYEELLVTLREMKVKGVREQSRSAYLKPINYSRNLFHVANAMTGVLLYQWVLSRSDVIWIMGILSATALILEITRRMSESWNTFLVEKVFGKVARPFERHHVNSSTYFTLSLLIVCTFFDRPVAQVGVLILGLADPAATISGKKWGRRKLYRDKSIVGTAAFLLVGTMAAFVFVLLALPSIPLGTALGYAFAIAAAGALAEVLTTRVDDNFTVPIAAASMAYLLF